MEAAAASKPRSNEARRCWFDLSAAGTLQVAQRFTFVFHCPTQRMALGLTEFLRYTDYAGFVRPTDDTNLSHGDPWRVAGTTRTAVRSLPGLEHLFMRLRGAAKRYDASLVTLSLVPLSPAWHERRQ